MSEARQETRWPNGELDLVEAWLRELRLRFRPPLWPDSLFGHLAANGFGAERVGIGFHEAGHEAGRTRGKRASSRS